MSKCNPHVWNYQDWLPCFRNAEPDYHDRIECRNCGRVLFIRDTTPNMRRAIARSMATRIFDGDEYEEIYEAAMDFFGWHLKHQAA